jgi:hypothetical protein
MRNFGFRSGTRRIELLVSLSVSKFVRGRRKMLTNFGIGTLAFRQALKKKEISWLNINSTASLNRGMLIARR